MDPRRLALHLAVALAPSLGCQGRPSLQSAEAAITEWLQAAHEGRSEQVRATFPGKAELAAWLTCPPEVDLAARFDAHNPEYGDWRGVVKSVALTPRGREQVPAGGPVGGCVARKRMTLERVDVTLHDGRVLAVRLVEVDGGYWMLGY